MTSIYDIARDATPRPDNPGNCYRRIKALRLLDRHGGEHVMEALEFIKTSLACRSAAAAHEFLINSGPELVETLENVEST